jgi:hypothetical protein
MWYVSSALFGDSVRWSVILNLILDKNSFLHKVLSVDQVILPGIWKNWDMLLSRSLVMRCGSLKTWNVRTSELLRRSHKRQSSRVGTGCWADSLWTYYRVLHSILSFRVLVTYILGCSLRTNYIQRKELLWVHCVLSFSPTNVNCYIRACWNLKWEELTLNVYHKKIKTNLMRVSKRSRHLTRRRFDGF